MTTQIVPIERAESGVLFVTSLTIAEGAGVEHRAVLQMIEKNSSDLNEFGGVAFQMRPLATAGGTQTQRVASMNEQQASLLMTYLRNTNQVKAFKLALIKGFFQMAKQLQAKSAPAELSRMEILRIAMAAEEEAEQLKAARAIDAPKVDYVDRFVADNDALLFRTVASNLGVGENALRWGLVYAGWIYHDQQRRRNSKAEIVTEHLWSEYAHKKPYFRRVLNHQAPLFKDNTMYTLKVTPPGAAAITSWVERTVAEHGSLATALPALEAAYNARKANAA